MTDKKRGIVMAIASVAVVIGILLLINNIPVEPINQNVVDSSGSISSGIILWGITITVFGSAAIIFNKRL